MKYLHLFIFVFVITIALPAADDDTDMDWGDLASEDVSEDMAPAKDTTKKRVANKEASEKEALEKDNAEKEVSREAVLKKDSSEKEAGKTESVTNETVKEDTTKLVVPEKKVTEEKTVTKEVVKKDIARKEASETVIPDNSIDSAYQPCKMVINIKGKDAYESLLVTAGKQSFRDTLIRFISPESLIDLTIDYSGFKRPQHLKIQFHHNTVAIDSSKALLLHIEKRLFKPQSRALLLQLSLDQTGWVTVLQSDTACTRLPVPFKLNTRKSRQDLGGKQVTLALNRYDINSVAIEPPAPYRTGLFFLEFPDPYGPPSLVEPTGLRTKLTLDNAKQVALVTVGFLPRTTAVTLKTEVHYAQGILRNVKTDKVVEIPQTTGIDSVQLECRNTYELILRKPGFNTLRKIIKVPDRDTSYSYTWQSFDRRKIILRSLALPGFGQYYSQRRKWWIWPVITATSAVFTVSSAVGINTNKSDFEEYNEKYLNETNAFARGNYDTRRREALSSWHNSDRVFKVSLGILAVAWGLNVGDAFLFSIGPRTKVSVNPLPGKRNLTIDF